MDLIERTWLMVARLQASCQWHMRQLQLRRYGQSTVEYALVGALVVIAAAGAMTLLGSEITTVFTRITNTLAGATSPGH